MALKHEVINAMRCLTFSCANIRMKRANYVFARLRRGMRTGGKRGK